MKLLHVEDREDDAVLMLDYLALAGLTAAVTRVETASETIGALAGQAFDAVISDFNLPAFSGAEALRIVRERDAEVPFIVFSGAIGEEKAVEMIRSGATDYVMKGNPARLASAVTRAVREAMGRAEKAQTDAALAETQQRCQATFEKAAVGIVHIAPDGRILDANECFLALIRSPREEIVGSRWSGWCREDDRDRAEGFLRDVARGTPAGRTAEIAMLRRDGSLFHASLTASAVHDAGGAPLYLVQIVRDVTLLRDAERALRQQTSLLSATIESAGEGIVVADFAGGISVMNRHFDTLFGLSQHGVDASSAAAVFGCIRAQSRNGFRHELQILSGDRARQNRGEMELTDGRVLEWFTAPQMIDGAPVGRVWSFRDVTERVRAAEWLAESEHQFRSVVENVPDVIWTADASGKARWVTANVAGMLGFTAEEICGLPQWGSLVHPDDAAAMGEAFGGLFEKGERLDVVIRMCRRDGQWRSLRIRASSVYQSGGVRVTDGVAADITDALAAQNEIERLARDRELLLDSAAEGIAGFDAGGFCTFANRSAVAILGTTVVEMIGRAAGDLFRRPPQAHKEPHPIDSVLATGRSSSVRGETLQRADGSTIVADLVTAPLLDDGPLRGVVVVFSDVTELRSIERKLEQTARVAALGQVAATVAHEFNNVLMGIQPFAEIIRRAARGDTKLTNATDQIGRSVNRGKRVVEEVLRFTRPVVPALKSVDIRTALLGLEAELKAIAGSAVTVVLEMPQRAVTIDADWPQIEQVITNLVANARDAMPSEGGAVVLRLADESDRICLDCIDTGTGIAEDAIEKIFEPMFTTKRTGTGLGLAVARRVVEAHGGSIVAESIPGKGTRFHLDLPRAGGRSAS